MKFRSKKIRRYFLELSFGQTNPILGNIVVEHPYPNVLESRERRIGATALVSISADGMWQSGMAYSEGMTNVYSSNGYLIDDNGDILFNILLRNRISNSMLLTQLSRLLDC